MHSDALMFFDKRPAAIPLYLALSERMETELGDFTVKVQKTQISFSNKYGFAFVSLPLRKAKGWPELCILVTFGLGRRVDDPRITQAVEPYPNRWTHHVIVQSTDEIDAQLTGWLREAYEFSLNK